MLLIFKSPFITAAGWSASPEAVLMEGEYLTPSCSGRDTLGEMGRQGKHEHPRQDSQRDWKSEGQSCWHPKWPFTGIGLPCTLTQSTTSASPGLVPGNLVKGNISLADKEKTSHGSGWQDE